MTKQNKSWIRSINTPVILAMFLGILIGVATMYLFLLQNTESRIVQLESLVNSAIDRSSEIKKSTEDIDSKINGFNNQIKSIETSLKSINTNQLEAINEIINNSGRTNNQNLLARIIELESIINKLGDQRGGTELYITNPRMGGKMANCPSNTFISSISASKGIGGKYGVDGISEIKVTCSPIYTK